MRPPQVSHSQTPTVQFCVRFPRAQYDALVALANREERSVSQVIRRATRAALEAHKEKTSVNAR